MESIIRKRIRVGTPILNHEQVHKIGPLAGSRLPSHLEGKLVEKWWW
jgi:hypothetical protein